jgi:sugar phosphate isomerase/epimerase
LTFITPEQPAMHPSRRELLALAAGALAAGPGRTAAPPIAGPRSRLGIASASYIIHARQERGFGDPLRFLAFCHARGAGGAQVGIGVRDGKYLDRLRAFARAHRLYLEGSVRCPRDREDRERFDAEVRCAKTAGAVVLRTVLLPTRRYETFRSLREFRAFRERSWASLQVGGPVVARHGVRLAVENHKDFRSAELAALLGKLKNEHVGVCVDLGNNLALLEDPLETVLALAPWAFACHLKDMAVQEYAGGFLLSEVPLGEGFLDLPRLVGLLRKARPEVCFSLEMITRDPLRIPCLGEGYWATFPDLPGRALARTLTLVRQHAWKKPLPRVSHLSREKQLEVEDDNVRRSLAHARKHLGL